MAKLPTVPTRQERPPEKENIQNRQQLEQKIQVAVLSALGQPPDLFAVNVRPLWDKFHRVNVLVGDDVVSVQIAHSYFVEAEESGNILSSEPRITRLYN